MYNSNIPSDRTLPSTPKLIKSTLLAVAGAAFLLVAVVMPAEYGIDPTGFGKVTGLQTMGEIKMSLAQEAEAEKLAAEQATSQEAASALVESEPPKLEAERLLVENMAVLPVTQNDATPEAMLPAGVRKDTMTVELAPNEGSEIKVDLKKGEVVKYSWKSNAGKANFDIHADSKPLAIKYHGYSKGSAVEDTGTIEAAFDGSHGWFWRNRSGAPLTVTIETEGPYTDIKKVK